MNIWLIIDIYIRQVDNKVFFKRRDENFNTHILKKY